MYVKADQRGTDFILEWDVRSKGDSSQGPWPSIPRLARAERGRPLSAWSGFARRLELRAGEAGPSGPQSLPGTPARLGHPGTVAHCQPGCLLALRPSVHSPPLPPPLTPGLVTEEEADLRPRARQSSQRARPADARALDSVTM